MATGFTSMISKDRRVFHNVWSLDRFTNNGRVMKCFPERDSEPWVHGHNITNEIKQVRHQPRA